MKCAWCGTGVHDAQCDWCGAPTGKPKRSRFDHVVDMARNGFVRPSDARRMLGIDEPRAMTHATVSTLARAEAHRAYIAGFGSGS